ncbi:ParB/RepB/Spo0J family partition protein [bacterium]|nr:ParB/RepB/Spo0J family partition protein [bacterium]
MSSRRKQALGKGLGALLGSARHTEAPELMESLASAEDTEPTEKAGGESLLMLNPSDIVPNPRQPRKNFDQEKLQELADSIHHHGILQPVLVILGDEDSKYTLLAGERRLRAAELAGLEQVPARLVQADESKKLELAIIENVHRDDLNPVEEALAYQSLANSFGYTQEETSKRVGKSRVAIANSLRLLKLPEPCLQDLHTGAITAGHARAILMLAHPTQQEQLRKDINAKGLSVREAESRAKRLLKGVATGGGQGKKSSDGEQQSLDVLQLQEKLLVRLGCKVHLRQTSAKSGSITIRYENLDDLDRILDILEVRIDD